MDTDSAASDSAPASPGASAAPVAMGHSPPRVTGASAYTSYFSRLSQLLSVSVKHYLPGTAAGSGAVDVPAPVAASDRLLGCSLQRGLRRHACSCARHRAHAASDATTHAPPATCCAAGCGAAGRHAGGSDAYKLYMCMCYTSGFQVWAVDGAGNGSTGAGGGAGAGAGIGPGHPLAPSFREVLSIRDQKAVRRMKIIATPCLAACMRHPDAGDSPSLLHEMPLVATLSAKADPEFPLTAVRLHSLRSGKAVHTLRMDAPVHDVVSSPDTVVVCMEASLALLNPLTLQRLHTIPCYPMPAAMAAVALGDRWLAYGAVELPPAPTQGDGNGTGHSGTGDDSGSGSGGVGKVRSASMDDDEADGGLWGVWSVAKGVASGLYGLKGVGEQTLSLVRTVGGAVAGAAGVGAAAPLPPLPPTTASGAPPVPPPAAADASSASGPASGSKKARPPPRKAAGCVIVRDSATQRVIAHFRSHYSPLVAMAFDASGSILATVAVEGQTIHVHQLLPAEAGAGSGVTPGIEAAWRRPGEGPTRQQRLLFRLERGLTHALVSSLKFSSGGAWLAATSAHGTTHLFSLSTRQYERAGGPPGAGGSPEAPRSEGDATPDVASVAVAPPPLPDAGAGDGGGALSGLASRFGAVLGLGRCGGSDAASGVTPSMAEYPAAISQQSYLAAWEQRQARAAGPVVRGACLRVRHVSAQADRTDGASAAHGGGAAPGATGGSGADGASGATGAAPTSGTGGAEGGEEDSGVSHPSMCSAVFAGTTSQHLVAASWGLLSVYELGVDEAASAAAEGADGGQVATSQQRGVWDMGRRADWGEVHQPAAILHASWTPPSRSHDARRGSRATAVTEELRAHWLSHADIHTHTQPVLPLWASPLFIMHKLQSKTPPLAADATHPPAQRRNGPSGPSGRRRSRGSRSRRGSDSSAPTQPVAQPAASSSQRPAPMTMADLFLDTSSSVPVTVRRAGPRPVVPAPGDPVMSGAVIMDDHFSPTHAREPPRAHQAAPQPQRPAPSAPPLAVSIRQALETPLADSFAPGDVDPPTDAPAMQASGPPSVHSSVRSGPSRRSSYDSGGSDSRDGARSVESGLMLALSSQQSDYFADQARAREAAIAQHHTDAVQSNAAAAAALFGGASPGSPAERPHLLTDDDDVTGSAILGERARVPAASSDEPPPPSASPRGSTPGTVPSRNSDGHSSANAWGAQDAEWLDSELGVASERHGRAAPRRAAPVPVGNKVAFDASRPNVASSDDDDDV